jgi:hypothetical protein
VAGKGHEVGQYVGAEVRPFDDRAVLAAEIRRAGATEQQPTAEEGQQ